MSNEIAVKPVERFKMALSTASVQEQFRNALNDQSGPFVASLIEAYSGDKYLQACEPKSVIMEALKAATLMLPINKSLGFAYLLAYKNKPQMQIGYKGLIQLALRSGQYKTINAGVVYEGEFRGYNKLTGHLDLTGAPTSLNPVGYFAYIELVNGFSKCEYMGLDMVQAHAARYSQSVKAGKESPWTTNFDEMAQKTVLKRLISRYGIMSIDMQTAIAADAEPIHAEAEVVDIPDAAIEKTAPDAPPQEPDWC